MGNTTHLQMYTKLCVDFWHDLLERNNNIAMVTFEYDSRLSSCRRLSDRARIKPLNAKSHYLLHTTIGCVLSHMEVVGGVWYYWPAPYFHLRNTGLNKDCQVSCVVRQFFQNWIISQRGWLSDTLQLHISYFFILCYIMHRYRQHYCHNYCCRRSKKVDVGRQPSC